MGFASLGMSSSRFISSQPQDRLIATNSFIGPRENFSNQASERTGDFHQIRTAPNMSNNVIGTNWYRLKLKEMKRRLDQSSRRCDHDALDNLERLSIEHLYHVHAWTVKGVQNERMWGP